MTSTELRVFAKKHGLTLAEARKKVKISQAQGATINGSSIYAQVSRVTNDVDFLLSSQFDFNANSRVMHLPNGVSNQEWGLANIVIYPPGSDNKCFGAMTKIGHAYFACVLGRIAWGEQPSMILEFSAGDTSKFYTEPALQLGILGKLGVDHPNLAPNTTSLDLEEIINNTVAALPPKAATLALRAIVSAREQINGSTALRYTIAKHKLGIVPYTDLT